MAKNRAKAAGKVADAATESARMRTLRIDGSQNGATLRTRIVRDKTKYSRTLKHKKSLADAGDFSFTFYRTLLRRPSGNMARRGSSLLLLYRMSRAVFARFR
ncbi:hypothetical protein SAMN05720487_12412 [Fibrobacter sp. UWT2]|nr:hypothetical protein SAMN05720487_12412 [Fibrobacter sp. UWT2]